MSDLHKPQDIIVLAMAADGVTVVRLTAPLDVLCHNFRFVQAMKDKWESDDLKVLELDLSAFSEETVAMMLKLVQFGVTDEMKKKFNWPYEPTFNVRELAYLFDKLQPIAMEEARYQTIHAFLDKIETVIDYRVAMAIAPLNFKGLSESLITFYFLEVLENPSGAITVDNDLLLEISKYGGFWSQVDRFNEKIILRLDFAQLIDRLTLRSTKSQLERVFRWYVRSCVNHKEEIPPEVYQLWEKLDLDRQAIEKPNADAAPMLETPPVTPLPLSIEGEDVPIQIDSYNESCWTMGDDSNTGSLHLIDKQINLDILTYFDRTSLSRPQWMYTRIEIPPQKRDNESTVKDVD